MTIGLDALSGRVAIIGSGIAGLVTALALAPRPVVLVTRAGLGGESSSALAQGGIAAALSEGDSLASHLADTLAAGDGLCEADVAEDILSDTRDAIAMLERHGVRFDRDENGGFVLGLEAAHGHRRILHAAGDGSGREIIRALVTAARRCASITVLAECEVRQILTEDGRISGIYMQRASERAVLRTSHVVLATGGIGGLYEDTTNPAGNCGEGLLLAARAGAALADMEFVQFHPTALSSPRRPLSLISEAVRGEGATLINGRGERFLAGTPGAELAPRDVVSRAIHAQIAVGERVFLDARGALGPHFGDIFPSIAGLCRAAGIDPARSPIPVRPAAHYHMGGVWTDSVGRTTLGGLWAVGECAATGLHGANRLASNSLLEAAVMGMRAARDIPAIAAMGQARPGPELRPGSDAAALRATVSRHLGILRDGDSLRAAIAGLLPQARDEGPAAVALSIAVFALLREESRGAHARTDFPAKHHRPTRQKLTLPQILAAAHETAEPQLVRSM